MTNIRNVEAVMERMLHLEMTRICKPYVRLAMTCPYSDRATMTKAQCEQINGQRDPLYYCQVRTHLQLVKRQIIGDLVNIELTVREHVKTLTGFYLTSLNVTGHFAEM